MDGRGGSEMRLNFSASGADEIREGIKRIGAVIAEQMSLYDSITTEHPQIPNAPPAPSASRPGAAGSAEGRASVLPFRRQGRQ